MAKRNRINWPWKEIYDADFHNFDQNTSRAVKRNKIKFLMIHFQFSRYLHGIKKPTFFSFFSYVELTFLVAHIKEKSQIKRMTNRANMLFYKRAHFHVLVSVGKQRKSTLSIKTGEKITRNAHIQSYIHSLRLGTFCFWQTVSWMNFLIFSSGVCCTYDVHNKRDVREPLEAFKIL